MKIKSLIASSGEQCMSRFPCVRTTSEDCMTWRNGAYDFDIVKLRQAVDGPENQGLVVTNDRDNIPVLVFAIDYMRQLEGVMRRLCDAQPKEAGAKVYDDMSDSNDKLDRQLKKHRYFVPTVNLRFDRRKPALVAKLTMGSTEENLIGNIEWANEYCVICARLLIYMKVQMAIDGNHLELEEGEGCEGVLAKAFQDDAYCTEERKINESNEKRSRCPYHVGEYCTPVHTDCECYRNGKCVALTHRIARVSYAPSCDGGDLIDDILGGK